MEKGHFQSGIKPKKKKCKSGEIWIIKGIFFRISPMCQCAQWLDAKWPDVRYYGILLVLCYIFECMFGIIDFGHLHLVVGPSTYVPWFGKIWHLGLNLGVMLKSGPATASFLVLKQLFSFFKPKLCSAFAF